MAQTIMVTVAGQAGVGKSAVAECIRRALDNCGVDVVLNDDNGIGIVDELPGTIVASMHSRLNGVKDRQTVVVVRTQMVKHIPSAAAPFP